jgi:hypothetical protein
VCFEGIVTRLATGCSWEDAERLGGALLRCSIGGRGGAPIPLLWRSDGSPEFVERGGGAKSRVDFDAEADPRLRVRAAFNEPIETI